MACCLQRNIKQMSNSLLLEKQHQLKLLLKGFYQQQSKEKLDIENITFQTLFSLTNEVYRAKINHQSFLLKIYQPTLPEFTDNRLESIIVSKLAQQNLYPKVLCCTAKYRIQQFVQSVEVTRRNLSNEKLSFIIKKLANFSFSEFNKTQGTINKFELTNLLKIFQAIYKTKKNECPHLIKKCQTEIQSIFHNNAIINKLLQILQKVPMMLCHNDCHLGNILSSIKGEYIIDYEFCQMNYLGYDLGNFLNEWATQYGTVFEIRQEIDKKLQHQIVKIYFNQLKNVYNCGEQFQKWLYYTKIGRALSHFFWMIIGLKQINDPRIEFSMVYYIKRRQQQFLKHFHELLRAKNDF